MDPSKIITGVIALVILAAMLPERSENKKSVPVIGCNRNDKSVWELYRIRSNSMDIRHSFYGFEHSKMIGQSKVCRLNRTYSSAYHDRYKDHRQEVSSMIDNAWGVATC